MADVVPQADAPRRFPLGTAPIKAEFVIQAAPAAPAPNDDAAEGNTGATRALDARDSRDTRDGGGPSRSKRESKEDKKKSGANKGRRFQKQRDDIELCWKVSNGNVCDFADKCRFTHDIPEYLAAKPRDISYSSGSELLNSDPFVRALPEQMTDASSPSVDTTTTCPIFAETGECRYGFKCRFLGGHVRKDESGSLVVAVDEKKKAHTALTMIEVNFVAPDLLKKLRTRKYPTPITAAYLKELQESEKTTNAPPPTANAVTFAEPEQEDPRAMVVDAPGASIEPSTGVADTPAPEPEAPEPATDAPTPAAEFKSADAIVAECTADSSSHVDTPDVPVRFMEKKRLNWEGKTYLAPLTTVGNLPFRRVCVDYGADITCGEMGLSTSFLGGSKEEWSLVRRHPSEKTFGVQIAGNKPATLVPTAEILAKELGGGIDFVDINCGCPIDLVFRAGSGSALLDAPGKLTKILLGMNKALGEIPVTIKLRTGVKDGKNNAHKLMPRISAEWGASFMSLHGRTRQQRYTRLADWSYIKECVSAVRAREADEDLPRIPIFGGGDCFSSQDYWNNVESTGVDGCLIARGALIKPWIFTEIQEHREWDISSRERLDGIRKYAEYAVTHFGSDTAGVNTARRYMCEALSFQYRYVPIGLLEQMPGRINDRAPAFRGRDDLETLLASGDSRDWVKITEMFLGTAPESWQFTPKHRSNSYGAEEAQG